MSIIPKLIHAFNTIQTSTGLFLELSRVTHGENSLCEDSQENAENEDQ